MEIGATPRRPKGSGKHCVVKSCSNNSRKITNWKQTECDIHPPLLHSDCACLQPYQMHRFPGGSDDKSQAIRMQWVKNINRKDFSPMAQSTVCSIHFPDGKPTADHPYPVLNIGYKPHKNLSPGRPEPRKRAQVTPKRKRSSSDLENASPMQNDDQQPCEMETQTDLPQMKDASIQWYDATITDHTYAQPEHVVRTQTKSTQTESVPDISVPVLDDNGVKFYTGISKDVFWSLLNSMMILLPLTTVCKFKLALHDQLLLFLMRLRLGLMFTDLGTRFKISRTTACEVFAAWLPLMAQYMQESIIFWPSRDTLERIRPKSFLQSFPKATCIIDCTEIFVQRPKNLKKRAQTYSNYKSHNTYKALYCIAPNGFVTYVSKLFGGRASDNFISQNSGFADQLIPGDEVLADRGFTIDDILPTGVKLTIPAFTKGHKDRRLPEEHVTGTRRIANVRIHVERAIRRLKCFKLLSNIIPARMENVDDILTVCAGLCNLQPCLIKEDIEDELEDMDINSESDCESDDEQEGNEGMDMFDIAEVDF